MRLACLLLPSERRKYSARTAGQRSGLVRTGDAGFSFVEIVVAMGIFALVATFMAQTLGSGLRGVLLGKRREIATQVANEMLEKARSLSFNAIGHIQPLVADPDIDGNSYNDEPLVFVPNVLNHPFNPHIDLDISRGSTTLDRYIYITWTESGLKRITVRVTWVDSGTQGPENEVRVQTLVNESGLIPTGRAGMPLTGKTFASGGALSVHSTLLGLGADPLNISLPTSIGSSNFRAVQTTSCTTRSTSIQALGLDVAPGYSVTTTVDDDSRTAIPPSASDSKSGVIWENPLPAPLSGLIGGVVDSPVTCEANAESLAYEEGTGSAVGLLNLTENVVGLDLLGLPILNWLLTVATVEALPVSQRIEHDQIAATREVSAEASTDATSIRILDLPIPILTHGLVGVDAISAKASVRATDGDGDPSAPPAADASAFTLRVLDTANSLGGSCQTVVAPGITASRSGQYCVINVSPSDAGFPGLSFQLDGSFLHNILGICLPLVGCPLLGVVNLSYNIDLRVLPPAQSPASGDVGPNDERRWSAEYSPLSVTAGLNATLLGAEIIDAAVDIDLGTVRAEACAGATCS